MTYGRNCNKNSVSNHRLEKPTDDQETRKENLRSLGTGSGALVARVPRDTHLGCVWRRRLELAREFVIFLVVWSGRRGS
jgi:hypothetical protein